MDTFHPDQAPHRIHTVHRVSAAALGGFLLLFAALGFAAPVGFLSTGGAVVMGLSTNGLLATVSVVVGVLLAITALRSGPAASTALVVVGALFLLSGVGNALVLDTPLNMLAFRVSNVVFSLVVGAVLLILGAYGRFTGALPSTSPYARDTNPTPADAAPHPVDLKVARALANAERAVAEHSATPTQTAGVAAAHEYRTEADRGRAFADVTAEKPDLF